MFSTYYQARVREQDCWYLVALLRSFEHLAFDRTVSKQTSTFEFFVSPGQEKVFLELIQSLQAEGVILEFCQMPNRLQDPQELV